MTVGLPIVSGYDCSLIAAEFIPRFSTDPVGQLRGSEGHPHDLDPLIYPVISVLERMNVDLKRKDATCSR